MGLTKNIPLFRYRFGSRDWCNRIINYWNWKCRPECSTWMRNIFLSVNGVGVIIKTNFVYVLWKDKRPTGVKFRIYSLMFASFIVCFILTLFVIRVFCSSKNTKKYLKWWVRHNWKNTRKYLMILMIRKKDFCLKEIHLMLLDVAGWTHPKISWNRQSQVSLEPVSEINAPFGPSYFAESVIEILRKPSPNSESVFKSARFPIPIKSHSKNFLQWLSK